MNPLVVLTYLTRKGGGIVESARKLEQEVSRQNGGRAMVCGLDDEFIEADLPAWEPVPVKVFKTRGPRQLQYAPGLRRYLDESGADILHTHGLWTYPSLAVSSWHRKNRKPYIISPHGMLDPWALRNSAWKKRLALGWYEREHLENAACLHALCESEARAMRQFGLKNPICIIPNGVNVPPWGAVPVEREASPFHGQARGRKVVLYLGRLHPKKGLTELLLAWAAFMGSRRDQADSWMLAVVGWNQGEYESTLRKFVETRGLADSICFPGPQFGRAKEACYRNCDAFILPSLSEGLPLVVLEAWSYGKPVLMTRECNLPEGFAVEAALPIDANPESIGQGLVNLTAMSEEDRQAMGGKGLRLVQERFAWPHIASQMLGLYSWALGGAGAPENMFRD